MNDTSVLIVGGGLVGLSAAIFLGDLGVPAILVERHRGTSTLPQGRGLNLRSMELYRSAGIEDALCAAPPSVLHDLPEIARADTLTGPELFRTTRPAPETYAGLSPSAPLTIDQNEVEPILREHAERRGYDLRFATRLRSFEQDGDGVLARLLGPDGREYQVRARYLLAADGHRSSIRRALGIPVGGSGTMARYANIPFAADLSGPLRGRPLALCYLNKPVPKTILTRLDDPLRWVLMVPYDSGRGERPADFTPERCLGLIREAVGEPGLPVEILRSHLGEGGQVQTWELASWVADRFIAGRVLLAGDAAHVMPPAGGLGGNTGVQDAHNLAWKLAAVLSGRAGPGLLETYEQERRPVVLQTCAYSARRQNGRATQPADGEPDPDPLAVTLGYRYRSAAIAESGDGEPAGRPGLRAPHVEVGRAGVRVSTLDLYRREFVLMAGAQAGKWADAAEITGGTAVYRIGRELDDVTGGWAAAHGVTDTGAVLVRPDGFVCWRAKDDSAAAPAALGDLLRRLHCVHEPVG